ncbi:MAG: DUF6112 family protein [Solirubrobacteraceae bacterium]|jgi:hypothetical protein
MRELLTFVLIASVVALILRVIVWAFVSSSPPVVSRSRTGVMAGVLAVLLFGSVVAVANFVFNVGAGL